METRKLHIAQITRVKLLDEAADILSANKHTEVLKWLDQWTPKNNFQAVVADSAGAALATLTEDLKANLVPSFMGPTVKPSLFEFQVSMQVSDNCRFWMPSALTCGTWYKIKE